MTRWTSLVVAALMVLAACSSADGGADEESTESASCQASAQKIIDRFDEFLEPFATVSPADFLAQPELEGLEEFQNDVADVVVEVASDPNDACTERDLQSEVEQALGVYAGGGILNRYLVGAVQQELQPEPRNLTVGPGDDLNTLLPLLGPGSSVVFDEGTYTFDATIIVQSELVMVGAGAGKTIIESSAGSAALAVLPGGDLVINDLALRHVGDEPASVLVALDASMEVAGVAISGGVLDAERGAGSGIVLSGESPDVATEVTISDSAVGPNEAAGIAITGSYAPEIVDATFESNQQCGACFFDESSGRIQSSTFVGNGVGLQASGMSMPEIALNLFEDNGVAGLLVENAAASLVIENTFLGEDIVGIDVQGEAAPVVQRNTFGSHAVAVSLRGESVAAISANRIEGGEVGVLIGGSATPNVFENELVGLEVAGFLHSEDSGGEFIANLIRDGQGAGIVVEERSTPTLASPIIDGGLVGVVFRQNAGGSVTGGLLSNQEVGLEVADESAPSIEDTSIVGAADAGMILSGSGAPTVRANAVEPIAIGIQASGPGSPLIEANTVEGGDTGVLVTESSTPQVLGNTLSGQTFGVGINGTASPMIEENEIRGALSAGLSFEGESAGVARGNTITETGVIGIRVGGQASPLLEANSLFAQPPATSASTDLEDPLENADAPPELAADAGAGILYAESGAGSAERNELFGYVIGLQVSDDAAPDLVANRIDGLGVGGVGILFGLAGSGTAESNEVVDLQLGFQISGSASPTLVDNMVERASAAAFLVQGEATPSLSGSSCEESAAGIVVLEAGDPELGANECPTVG